MLGSRRGRPSLIGRAAHTAARTAVIAGTANAVTTRQSGRRQVDASAPPQTSKADTPMVPQALDEAGIARLRQLAELHETGILSTEQFETQKARLLA